MDQWQSYSCTVAILLFLCWKELDISFLSRLKLKKSVCHYWFCHSHLHTPGHYYAIVTQWLSCLKVCSIILFNTRTAGCTRRSSSTLVWICPSLPLTLVWSRTLVSGLLWQVARPGVSLFWMLSTSWMMVQEKMVGDKLFLIMKEI